MKPRRRWLREHASACDVASWPVSTVRGSAVRCPKSEERSTSRGHRKLVEFEPEADIQQQLVQASTKHRGTGRTCASARSTPLFTRCRLGPDLLICSPAASTTHRHGREKHCGRSRTTFPRLLSPPQAMRSPDVWRKRGKPWHACAGLIRRCGCLISRTGFRFAALSISLVGQRVCGRAGLPEG